jgi:phosphatidylinositol glycan class V
MQLPWVVQSIPVVALSFLACCTWACHDWIRAFTLSFCPPESQRLVEKARQARSRLHHSCCLVEPSVAPYVYHLALMTAVSVLVMHVNVATRFLSSSPLIYWYMAQFMLNGSLWRSYVVWGWSLLYACLGSVLFINFYPWT